MTKSIIKLIGVGATVIGLVAQVASNWVDEKKMEAMINEKVDEAMNQREEKEES